MTVRTGSRRGPGGSKEGYSAIIKGFALTPKLQSNGLHPFQIRNHIDEASPAMTLMIRHQPWLRLRIIGAFDRPVINATRTEADNVTTDSLRQPSGKPDYRHAKEVATKGR